MQVLEEIEKEYIKDRQVKPGEVVKVYTKVDKEREVVFEGVVIATKREGINKTFTVRRVSQGVGVEIIYPLYSDNITKIEVIKEIKRRRAKLYYLREKKKKLY